MCYRLYKLLNGNDILYRKQFGFQEKYSTEHAIIQLVDQFNCSFQLHICLSMYDLLVEIRR